MATAVVVHTAPVHLNEQNPAYKCCCGSIHVKTGALVIGIIDAILTIIFIASIASAYARFDIAGIPESFIVPYSFAGICLICLFIGIHLENRCLVVPIIVVCMIRAVVFCIGAILAIVVAAAGASLWEDYTFNNNDGIGNYFTAMGLILLAIYAFLAGIYIWWFVVYMAFFRYLRDKQFLPNGPAPMAQTVHHAQPVVYGAQPGVIAIQQPGYPQPQPHPVPAYPHPSEEPPKY